MRPCAIMRSVSAVFSTVIVCPISIVYVCWRNVCGNLAMQCKEYTCGESYIDQGLMPVMCDNQYWKCRAMKAEAVIV